MALESIILREHAADPLAAGEDGGLLQRLVPGEEHPPEEAPGEALPLGSGQNWREPLDEVQVVVEVGAVLLREIGVVMVTPQRKLPLSGSSLAGEDLEEGRPGEAVVADEGDLVPLVHGEGEVVEDGDAVDRLGEVA